MFASVRWHWVRWFAIVSCLWELICVITAHWVLGLAWLECAWVAIGALECIVVVIFAMTAYLVHDMLVIVRR